MGVSVGSTGVAVAASVPGVAPSSVGTGVAVGSGAGVGGTGVYVGVGGGGFGVGVGNISTTAGIVAVGLGSAARPQPTIETISKSIQIRENFFISDTPFKLKV